MIALQKHAHVLIPRLVNVALFQKRVIADVNKLRIFRIDQMGPNPTMKAETQQGRTQIQWQGLELCSQKK